MHATLSAPCMRMSQLQRLVTVQLDGLNADCQQIAHVGTCLHAKNFVDHGPTIDIMNVLKGFGPRAFHPIVEPKTLYGL